MLSLAALSDFSLEVAETLARHRGQVHVSDLSKLPSVDWAREALRRHGGELDHVSYVTPAAARELASHEGPLSLNGLLTASDEVIAELARHQGSR